MISTAMELAETLSVALLNIMNEKLSKLGIFVIDSPLGHKFKLKGKP